MADEALGYICPFFNQHLKIPGRVSDKVRAVYPAEYEDTCHCVGLIVVNLLALGEVAYSRNSNFYTEHHAPLFTRTSMKRAVDAAVTGGYAVRSREGYRSKGFKTGLSSTIAAGPRLNEFGPPLKPELDIESLPVLVVDKFPVYGQEGLASLARRPAAVSPESFGLTDRLPAAYGEAVRLNRDYWNRVELDVRGA